MVVAVGVMTVLKVIQRESYCRRFLISRNFGDGSEVVSVVSKDIDFGGLIIKFINNKYSTTFRSHSLIVRTLLAV